MAKDAMGPIAPPHRGGAAVKPPTEARVLHPSPQQTTYAVAGTTVQPPGPFTNKDAMLAFVRAHLPASNGTVAITIHTAAAG